MEPLAYTPRTLLLPRPPLVLATVWLVRVVPPLVEIDRPPAVAA